MTAPAVGGSVGLSEFGRNQPTPIDRPGREQDDGGEANCDGARKAAGLEKLRERVTPRVIDNAQGDGARDRKIDLAPGDGAGERRRQGERGAAVNISRKRASA